MNNSVSSTVVVGFSKTKWIVLKLAGLTLVGVCMLHCSAVDWVRECVTGCVTCWASLYRGFMSMTFCSSISMLMLVKSLHVESFNGKMSQDKKTTTNAIKYRRNQEIKFLYCEKQNLNQQLYRIHLQCARCCNGMWQRIKNSINSCLDDIMNTLYQKLNKKLDTLIRHTLITYNTERNTHFSYD